MLINFTISTMCCMSWFYLEYWGWSNLVEYFIWYWVQEFYIKIIHAFQVWLWQPSGVCSSGGQVIILKCPKAVQHASGQGWQWYDWKGFLSKYFRKLTGIRKYAYFRFSQYKPGVVYVRQRIRDEETARCLIKRGVEPPNAMCPAMLKPAGLTLDRQNYLFKQIRPFVRPDCQMLPALSLRDWDLMNRSAGLFIWQPLQIQPLTS